LLDAPPTWADFWDPKYAKKITIPPVTFSNGLMLLAVSSHIESGKPIAEAQYDADSGFAGLEKLLPNVFVVIANINQGIQAIIDGDAVMGGPFFSKHIAPFLKEGAPLAISTPPEGTFALLNALVIVKGGPHPDLASEFIDFGISKDLQEKAATLGDYGPVHPEVQLETGLAERIQITPDVLESLVVLDWDYVNMQRPTWTDRWNALIQV